MDETVNKLKKIINDSIVGNSDDPSEFQEYYDQDDFENIKNLILTVPDTDPNVMQKRDKIVEDYFVDALGSEQEIYDSMVPVQSGGDYKGPKSNIIVSIGFGIAVIFSTVLIGSSM
jgi:hypothetical protein